MIPIFGGLVFKNNSNLESNVIEKSAEKKIFIEPNASSGATIKIDLEGTRFTFEKNLNADPVEMKGYIDLYLNSEFIGRVRDETVQISKFKKGKNIVEAKFYLNDGKVIEELNNSNAFTTDFTVN